MVHKYKIANTYLQQKKLLKKIQAFNFTIRNSMFKKIHLHIEKTCLTKIVSTSKYFLLTQRKVTIHPRIPSDMMTQMKKEVFSPGIEPGTFCVLDRCDNHYTTKTPQERKVKLKQKNYRITVQNYVEKNKSNKPFFSFLLKKISCFYAQQFLHCRFNSFEHFCVRLDVTKNSKFN